jgi:TatD DNase family protein
METSSYEQWYLVDTHCHLNLLVNPTFNTSLTDQHLKQAAPFIEAAQQENVLKIINVGTSIIDSQNCIALAQRYSNLFVAVGLHPSDISANWHDDFKQITTWAQQAKEHAIVAIGETGLDCYRSRENLPQQLASFKAHIELALTHNLAIIVHTRAAAEETLNVLHEYKKELSRCVIHCYPYDRTFAQEALSCRCFLGIGGPITYPKNVQLQTVVQEIDLSHIVLETDAPYLPPQIIRGQKNSPMHIRTIAQAIADLKNTSLEEVASITTHNASSVFRLFSR